MRSAAGRRAIATSARAANQASSSQWFLRRNRDQYADKAQELGLRSRAAFKLDQIQNEHRFLRTGHTVIDLGAAPGGWSTVAARLVASAGSASVRDLRAPPTATPASLARGEDALAGSVALQRKADGAGRPRVSIFALGSAEVAKARGETATLTPTSTPTPIVPDRTALRPSSNRVIAVDLLPMEPVRGVDFLQGDFTRAWVQDAVLALLGARPCDAVLSDMAHSFVGDGSTDHVRQMDLAHTALTFAQRVLRPGGSFLVKVRHGSSDAAFRALLGAHFGRVLVFKPDASRSESAEYFLLALKHKRRGRAVERAGEVTTTTNVTNTSTSASPSTSTSDPATPASPTSSTGVKERASER